MSPFPVDGSAFSASVEGLEVTSGRRLQPFDDPRLVDGLELAVACHAAGERLEMGNQVEPPNDVEELISWFARSDEQPMGHFARALQQTTITRE